MKKLMAALLFAGLLPATPQCEETESSACSSPATQANIEQGDQAYQNRLEEAEAQRALSYYANVVEADPSCVEAYLRAAKTAWWVADQSSDRREKLDLFQKGIDWAKEAIRLEPGSPSAHYWLAVNYGSFGESKGIMKSLFLVKPIREALNEVIRLDSSYENGGAHRILGVVDYKVPPLAGGNKKRALEQLTKAMELGPHDPFNLFYMAEYHALMKAPQLANEHLDRLTALSPSGEDGPYVVLMQKKGQELKESLPKSD